MNNIDSTIINLDEIANPAYQRNNGTASNLKAIWQAIDRKQAQLQIDIFGELNDKLGDIAAPITRYVLSLSGTIESI